MIPTMMNSAKPYKKARRNKNSTQINSNWRKVGINMQKSEKNVDKRGMGNN